LFRNFHRCRNFSSGSGVFEFTIRTFSITHYKKEGPNGIQAFFFVVVAGMTFLQLFSILKRN